MLIFSVLNQGHCLWTEAYSPGLKPPDRLILALTDWHESFHLLGGSSKQLYALVHVGNPPPFHNIKPYTSRMP